MNEHPVAFTLETVPKRLFFSTLPAGEREFSCFIPLSAEQAAGVSGAEITWRIRETTSPAATVGGKRNLTAEEGEAGRVFILAVLPATWGDSRLQVKIRAGDQTYAGDWPIAHYDQPQAFQLPLDGQLLVLVGHRIGEVHRSAWQIPSQQFAWDLLPLDGDGLRLLRGRLTDPLRADAFCGFGSPVLAPAAGRVVRVMDGYEDGVQVGPPPQDKGFYLEDLRRAAGNHVIIEHGDGIYAFLAHLQKGSMSVAEDQVVEAGARLGALGNSGHSSGPHLHLHFMDGPDLLAASPLPVALEVEGSTFAPQAGDIISR